MKILVDHSFRYTVFYLSLFILYAAATGFKKPDASESLMLGIGVLLACGVLGTISAAVGLGIKKIRQ